MVNYDEFFGLHIDRFTLGGQSVALMLAVVLGGVIGLEREWRGQAAGLRTHILVCVGATIMTITSAQIGMGATGAGPGDPAHLAAQIVSGIGFLGAGAIIRAGGSVHGLTTAASVWATAGIGIALGASPRLGELAVVGTVIVLSTLTVLTWLEKILKLKKDIYTLQIEVKEADHGPARVLEALTRGQIVIYSLETLAGRARQGGGEGTLSEPTCVLRLSVCVPGGYDPKRLNALLMAEPGLISFELE